MIWNEAEDIFSKDVLCPFYRTLDSVKSNYQKKETVAERKDSDENFISIGVRNHLSAIGCDLGIDEAVSLN